MLIWMVIRWCCTSGNCDTCGCGEHKLPFGHRYKVCQLLMADAQKALDVCEKWREYEAEVKQATEEEIAKLHPKTQVWVRQELARLQGLAQVVT